MTPNSPAQEELLRGDIITKIEDYDARDLTHQDAQRLFRQAEGQIKLVIRRDDIIAVKQTYSSAESSRCSSTVPPHPPPYESLEPLHQSSSSPNDTIGYSKGYIYGPVKTY